MGTTSPACAALQIGVALLALGCPTPPDAKPDAGIVFVPIDATDSALEDGGLGDGAPDAPGDAADDSGPPPEVLCNPDDAMPCAPGTQCTPIQFMVYLCLQEYSICLDGCEVSEDCRDGYACQPDDMYPERMHCAPGCTRDTECTSPGFRCDEATGRCTDA